MALSVGIAVSSLALFLIAFAQVWTGETEEWLRGPGFSIDTEFRIAAGGEGVQELAIISGTAITILSILVVRRAFDSRASWWLALSIETLIISAPIAALLAYSYQADDVAGDFDRAAEEIDLDFSDRLSIIGAWITEVDSAEKAWILGITQAFIIVQLGRLVSYILNRADNFDFVFRRSLASVQLAYASHEVLAMNTSRFPTNQRRRVRSIIERSARLVESGLPRELKFEDPILRQDYRAAVTGWAALIRTQTYRAFAPTGNHDRKAVSAELAQIAGKLATFQEGQLQRIEPSTSTARTRSRSLLQGIRAIVAGLIPLATLLLLMGFGVDISPSLLASLTPLVTVWAATAILTVLDPRSGDRAQASQSVLTMFRGGDSAK